MRIRENMELVLVEDDGGDVLLMQEALKATGLKLKLSVFHRGEEAVAYLRARAPSLPAHVLVLLDLNLPGTPGIEILARLKTDPRTRAIPVIVLSTTDSDREVRLAYEACANSFVTKPRTLDGLISLMRCLDLFWLGMGKLVA